MSKPAKIHTVESLLQNTTDEGDCKLWDGAVGFNGTPHVYLKPHGVINVRKAIYILQGKHRPNYAFYGMKCDNPLCINPAHIDARTKREQYVSMAHAVSKAPSNPARIAKIKATRRANPLKINAEIAKAIRESDKTYVQLAAIYGIDRSWVGKIKRGEVWAEAGRNVWAGFFAASDRQRRAA